MMRVLISSLLLCALFSADGVVYAWGDGGHGVLGSESNNLACPTPVEALLGAGARAVCAGGCISMVLATDV